MTRELLLFGQLLQAAGSFLAFAWHTALVSQAAPTVLIQRSDLDFKAASRVIWGLTELTGALPF